MKLSRKAIVGVVALFVAAALIFGAIKLYEDGYRITFTRGITRPSTIVLVPFTQGATLFYDGEPVLQAKIADDVLTLPVPAGLHDITIARNGYHPWAKAVDVESSEEVVIHPFSVPVATNGVVLNKTDAEYAGAVTRLQEQVVVPTPEQPVFSRDGNMSAFVRDASLVARIKDGTTPPQYFCDSSCNTEKNVVDLAAEVRGLAFLPGRSDVLLMAVQDGVFAIELDTRGTQNFQVVYRGIRPTFAVTPEGFLYIKDNESIFKVFLFPANQ